MAYDRAERVISFASGNPLVGPTTYYLEYDWIKNKNYAPFLSLSLRENKKFNNTSPSPYTYNPAKKERVLGGSSLRNRAPRCQNKEEAFQELGDEENDNIVLQKIGYIYHCTPPSAVGKFCPSVPPKNHQGYTFDETGILTPIKLPEENEEQKPSSNFDPPDLYNKGKLSNRSIKGDKHVPPGMKRHKGWSWSKDRTQRFENSTFKTPGPGTYNLLSCPSDSKPKDEVFREIAKRSYNLPRYLDAMQKQLLRENMPSPAEYTISSVKDFTAYGFFKNPKNPQKFLVTSERFCYKSDDNPSPTQYNLASSFGMTPIVGRTDFQVKAKRFPDSKNYSPGPAAYTLKSFCGLVREPLFGCKQSAFNTSAPRHFFSGQTCTPSPNTYTLRYPPSSDHPTAAFSSKTVRFKCGCPNYAANCGSYNIIDAFEFTNGKKYHRKTKCYNFNSSVKRFNGGTGNDGLGAATYNLSSYHPGKKNNVGSFGHGEARLRQMPTTMPAPCQYDIHPRYGSSVLKGTFNVTLCSKVPRYRTNTYSQWKARYVRKMKRSCIRPCQQSEPDNERENESTQILDVISMSAV